MARGSFMKHFCKKFRLIFMHPRLEGGSTVLEGTIAKIFGMYSYYCTVLYMEPKSTSNAYFLERGNVIVT